MAPPDPDKPASLSPALYVASSSRGRQASGEPAIQASYDQPPVPENWYDDEPQFQPPFNHAIPSARDAFHIDNMRAYVAELNNELNFDSNSKQPDVDADRDSESNDDRGSESQKESLPQPRTKIDVPVPIGLVVAGIATPAGDVPENTAAEWFAQFGEDFQAVQSTRGWYSRTFPWTAPADRHQPLYFEDVNLERYGFHFGCMQPLVSAAKFCGGVPWMMYKEVAQPWGECTYDLGKYRPGTPSCLTHQRPRMYLPAATVEALWVAGLILFIP